MPIREYYLVEIDSFLQPFTTIRCEVEQVLPHAQRAVQAVLNTLRSEVALSDQLLAYSSHAQKLRLVTLNFVLQRLRKKIILIT